MADDNNTHDTHPGMWSLQLIGEQLWALHHEFRQWREDATEVHNDLQRRLDALEHGFRLVPLDGDNGDNGAGG